MDVYSQPGDTKQPIFPPVCKKKTFCFKALLWKQCHLEETILHWLLEVDLELFKNYDFVLELQLQLIAHNRFFKVVNSRHSKRSIYNSQELNWKA